MEGTTVELSEREKEWKGRNTFLAEVRLGVNKRTSITQKKVTGDQA